jgi:hypothetical protein
MGCTTTQRSSQKLDARKWYYGSRECRSITFADDTAGDQDGQNWDLNGIDENYAEKKYLAYLDLGGLGAAVPTPAADQTLLAIDYTSGDDAATIAGLAQTAIDAVAEFNCIDNADGSIECENSFLGEITTEDQSGAPNLTFVQNQAASGGFLGALDQGGATMSSEVTALEIKADDTYEVVLDKILQGSNVNIEMPLAEMSDLNWKNLVGGGYGDTYTSGSDELVGYGTSKLGQSAFQYARQLVGHPVAKPFSDRSEDICMWKSVAELSSINFSGTDKQVGEASFPALQDSSKPEEIDLACRGDHSLI